MKTPSLHQRQRHLGTFSFSRARKRRAGIWLAGNLRVEVVAGCLYSPSCRVLRSRKLGGTREPGFPIGGSGLRYEKGERFDRQAQTISSQRSRSYKDSAITGSCHDPMGVTIHRGRWLVVTLPVLRTLTSY